MDTTEAGPSPRENKLVSYCSTCPGTMQILTTAMVYLSLPAELQVCVS